MPNPGKHKYAERRKPYSTVCGKLRLEVGGKSENREKSLRLSSTVLLPPVYPVSEEVTTMQWEFVVALVLAIPIILFPVAYIWYLNAGGIYAAIKEARARRVAREKGVQVVTKVK
jgi:hypothetical protein